jgi:alanine-alpha-ketoisovalerate/valine-pyruvate aminotransferase
MAMGLMINGFFEEPVRAGSDPYYVEEIGSVGDAVGYMEARSFDENDVIAKVTRQTLSRCLDGRLPVSVARETFYRMLKKKGLLFEPGTAFNIGLDQDTR